MAITTRLNPYAVQPQYAGIYAHGVETSAAARTVYVSGQTGLPPRGELPDDFHGQCRQAIRNVESVLRESGMTLADIVKMGFFLTRRDDMAGLLEVRKAMLDGVRPAITTVFVAGLVDPNWLVEVEAIACAGKSKPAFVRRLGSI